MAYDVESRELLRNRWGFTRLNRTLRPRGAWQGDIDSTREEMKLSTP